MSNDFETAALQYLFEEMDATQRAVFEEQLKYYPAARIALEECTASLDVLRRQALDLPFFGRVVRSEITSMMQTFTTNRRAHVRRGARMLRELVALS